MRKVGPHSGYVYMLASKRNGTLYMGVTSDPRLRTYQHKTHYYEKSFTAKYNVNMLVWYEFHEYIGDAIKREKQLKKYYREWKVALIEKDNLLWKDLTEELEKIYND